MHLTKNLCVNLIAFLGVYRKTKDTLEARQELQHMEERDALHPEKRDNGQHYLCPASYTLSKEEKESMFECLSSIKVPSGYSSNIKGILNLLEKKFTNLKSRSCHVLMTELLLAPTNVTTGKAVMTPADANWGGSISWTTNKSASAWNTAVAFYPRVYQGFIYISAGKAVNEEI